MMIRVRVSIMKLLLSIIFALYAGTALSSQSAVATFAGGCFWCMEPPFDKLPGVIATTSGYTDGKTVNPTYQQVSAGITGHTEAIQIEYDPSRVSYEQLISVFWKNIDPTVADRQFCDKGSQYRSGIYYHNDMQKKIAEASLRSLEKNKPFKEPVVTQLAAASAFYPAEDYHQNYYQKKPVRYKFYRYSCGRDARLNELWNNNN